MALFDPKMMSGLLGDAYVSPMQGGLQGAAQAVAPLAGWQSRPVSMGQVIGALGGGMAQGQRQAMGQNLQMAQVAQQMEEAKRARAAAAQQAQAMQALAARYPEYADAIRAGYGADVIKAMTRKPEKGTTAHQNALALGLTPGTPDYNSYIRQATIQGAVGGVQQTPAQKAIDIKYAGDYLEWMQGGRADTSKNIEQLSGVIKMLETDDNLTGPEIGVQPDTMLALTNPKALAAKERVSEVVQRNLRVVLGAQFTEREGQMLINRAYNPLLTESENADRLKGLLKSIEEAAKAKDAAAAYYDANGTLRGFTGALPTVESIAADAFGGGELEPGKSKAKPSNAPKGVAQELWDEMTPEERSAWD